MANKNAQIGGEAYVVKISSHNPHFPSSAT